jgi:enoyl-[acyl-carrier protein] reductase I
MDSHLKGKKALIVGVANERSLAWSIAKHLREEGMELAFTYLGEALERRVRPLAEEVGASIVEPLNVQDDAQVAALFQKIQNQWGELDVLVHSIAFADRQDLDGRFVDTSRSGFLTAMDVSAFSLVQLSRASEPLMKQGGSILTLTYYGAQKVVPNYNVMGVAKAALEASVRYLAQDLGPKKIRVNAISAGPVKTLAAAGIRDFRSILAKGEAEYPLRENIDQDDVGALGCFLASPLARHITGSTYFVDSGAHILA